jgi:hypothetical protein
MPPLAEGEYPIPGCKIRRGDVVTIADAKIIWPNFAGDGEKGFDAEGDRNFNLHLTKQQADDLAADGWNVKCKPARPDDPDSEDRCVLKVKVSFKNKPPRIISLGSLTRNRAEYTEQNVGLLDSADMLRCDVSIVPYFWDVNGNIGVSAYLSRLYFEIQEDYLDEKWAEIEAQGPVD